MIIDDDKLREDLEEYYGTAAFNGSGPGAFGDLINVRNLTPGELVREAQDNGFDLNQYCYLEDDDLEDE